MNTKKLRGILKVLGEFGVVHYKTPELELVRSAPPQEEAAQQEFSMDSYAATPSSAPAQAQVYPQYTEEEILHWSSNP